MAEQGSLVRLQQNFDIQLDWRGFELHPEIPPGGVPLRTYFPSIELDETRRYLTGFAARFGIDAMVVSDHVPSTRRALAVTEYARAEGKLDGFRNAAMSAFWRRGEDIEDDAVLARLAAEIGLDPRRAVAAATDGTYLAALETMRQEAARRGVTAIPAFFIGEPPVILVGCQPYERLAQAVELALASGVASD